MATESNSTTAAPALVWPFQAGQAVYYVPSHQAFRSRPQTSPAVVLGLKGNRVNILREDGARRTVNAEFLLYRGICAACQVPAIERAGLLACPACDQPASELPSDAQLVCWYPASYNTQARAARHSLTTGCTWGQAFEWRLHHDCDAFQAMLKQTGIYDSWSSIDDTDRAVWREIWSAYINNTMTRYALLGDAEGFVATFEAVKARYAGQQAARAKAAGSEFVRLLASLLRDEDNEQLPSRRLDPPQLHISLPAGDDRPDDQRGTAFDAWLERQLSER